MTEALKKEIAELRKAIKVLIRAKCWGFLNKILVAMTAVCWRTDVNILAVYAKTTLTSKNNLPNREIFVYTCKKLYPDCKLWKGLD